MSARNLIKDPRIRPHCASGRHHLCFVARYCNCACHEVKRPQVAVPANPWQSKNREEHFLEEFQGQIRVAVPRPTPEVYAHNRSR